MTRLFALGTLNQVNALKPSKPNEQFPASPCGTNHLKNNTLLKHDIRVCRWNRGGEDHGKLVGELKGHTFRVHAFLVYDAKSEVISFSGDGTVRVWDLNSFAEARKFNTNDNVSSNCTPCKIGETSLVACAGIFKNINIWDSETGEIVHGVEKFLNGSLAALLYSLADEITQLVA